MTTLPASAVTEFHEDCRALVAEKLARGALDRRQALRLMAALVALPVAGLGREAAAQARELVMVNFGGIGNEAFKRFYIAPFEAKNPGVKVATDTSGGTAGRIRTMIESGKITWDVIEASAHAAIEFGKLGYLEPIDYGIVDRTKAPTPGHALTHGIASYTFSSVLAYDASKFGSEPPKTWADFWDLKKYPGKRMLRRQVHAVMDAAVMSDGVAIDKVYPIDVKRGFDRIRQIRKDCVFWNNGSESEQIMRGGEAVMGIMWHTRAKVLFEETKGRIDHTFNQGILQPGTFIVMKGNPGGKLAMNLLASMMEPEPQVELFKFLGNGPTNPAAVAMIPPELRRFDPMSPDNLKVQCLYDGSWYAEHQAKLIQDYLDLISS